MVLLRIVNDSDFLLQCKAKPFLGHFFQKLQNVVFNSALFLSTCYLVLLMIAHILLFWRL